MSRALYEKAYREFWDVYEANRDPKWCPLPYELTERIQGKQWPFFQGLHLAGDLSELINLLNHWRQRLQEWSAWQIVIPRYGQDDAWSLRNHFLESLVFYCMFQPSAARDRLGMHATEVVHQANLAVDPAHKDELDQDKGAPPNRFLQRRAVEGQLLRISRRWSSSKALMDSIRALDAPKYRQTTLNFRNRASHALAPRFELGITRLITRSIVPDTIMAERRDGRSEPVEHPTRRVSYSFGGTPPLTLAEMFKANLKEFDLAIAALTAHQALIEEILPKLKNENPPVAGAT